MKASDLQDDLYQVVYENRIHRYLWQKTTGYYEPMPRLVRKIDVRDESCEDIFVPIKWNDGHISLEWRPF